MAVIYKLREYKMDKKSDFYGTWYAHTVSQGVVTTNELAEMMQRNATVKKSDVLAVLAELSETMRQVLQAGNVVQLEGLGSFRINIHSRSGVRKEEDFSMKQDVLGLRVSFRPQAHYDAQRQRQTAFSEGARAKALPVRQAVATAAGA